MLQSLSTPKGAVKLFLLLLLFMATLVPTYAAVQSSTTDTMPSSNAVNLPDDDDGPDWFAIAAETIGMEQEALEEALANGQTIADVATSQGVEPQTVIDAIITATTDWINQQVADGEMTQEEADEWLAELPEYAAAFVEEPFDDDDDGDGDWNDGTNWFAVAAETIGVDEEALWEALENGQTIADVATSQGVEPQAVIDALIAADTELINQLLADGEITQEEADEWLALLPEMAAAFVEEGFDDDDDGDDDENDGPDWFAIAAETIGMEQEALEQALENGQTIADVATSQGVEPQAVIDALIAAETELINQLLADGEMTQEEADEWLAELPQEAAAFVEEGFDDDDDGDGDGDENDGPDWFAIAAETIGIEQEALEEALENGQTIADVATEAGVEPQAVIDALIAADTAWIDQLVADGEITQEEADEWLAERAEDAAAFVEELYDDDDDDDGDGDENDGPDWFAIAAETIGMEQEALEEALENGQTIADVATEAGVEPQAVIDAIIAADTAWIDQLLADGEITQEEADEWLAELAEDAAAFVEEPYDGGNDGDDDDFWGGPEWFAVAAETIGVDEDTLWEALANGQSIVDVAIEQEVEPQAVIDAIIAAETAWIDQLVIDAVITQEKADQWLENLPEEVEEFVYDSDDEWDDFSWFAIAAEEIGVDEETLSEALEQGLSIAEFAQQEGVDPQAIVDAIVEMEAEWINELIEEGVITQEEADEWLAEIEIDAMAFVQCATDFPTDSIHLEASSGENSINLSWTLLEAFDNEFGYYQINRSADEGDYTAITDTVLSQYTDNDPALTAGTEYCYQINAYDSDDMMIAASNMACVEFGALTLWVPNQVVEPDSTNVNVPINLANGTGLCATAMDITVSYDSAIVSATGTVSPTIFTEGYAFAANTTEPGKVKIASISGTDNCEELYGGGSLFVVGFNVTGSEGDVSPVDFIEGLTGTVIYDDDNLDTPVDLALQNGSLSIANEFIRGDVNGDGVINSADAARVLLIDSGLVTVSEQQRNACDVNGDGACNAADASLILCYAAFGDWDTCGGSDTSQRLAHQAQGGTVDVTIGSPQNQAGQKIVVPVNLTNASDFAGGNFLFTYDASKMTATGASLTSLTNGFQLRSNVQQAGVLQVSIASKDAVAINGGILNLEFTTTNGTSSIDFASVRLNDAAGRDFETSALQRELQLTPYNHNDTSNGLIFSLYLPSIIR